MLRGMFPNPDGGAMQRLREHFGSQIDNAAFRRAVLRCFPDSISHLKIRLAEYIERGLEIRPIEIGPHNLGQIGFESLTAL